MRREELLAVLPDPRPISTLELLDEVDSTNARLLAAAREGAPDGALCIAGRQSAGRGRAGRQWISPPGGNLYLSLLGRFADGRVVARGLSLALGLAVWRVLTEEGVEGVGLKWPNDLHWRGRKLGGLLVETVGAVNGPCAVVAGLGLNLRMPREAAAGIDQPWADLEEAGGGDIPPERLAGRIVAAWSETRERFEAEGLAPFQDQWRRADLLDGRAVRIHPAQGGGLEGTARGIDGDGALLVEINGELRRFHSAEVSVRVNR